MTSMLIINFIVGDEFIPLLQEKIVIKGKPVCLCTSYFAYAYFVKLTLIFENAIGNVKVKNYTYWR